MRVLVTGASGFVGQVVVERALAAGHTVTAAMRPGHATSHSKVRTAIVGEIGSDTVWDAALADVEVVIHVAGRAHVMRDQSTQPVTAFRRVNTQGTKRLAEEAARCGVRRLVFVSSIKVNGERTVSGRPFVESDVARPSDPYGISKWEGEQALAEVAARTGLEFSIVRPPLVYGPGVRANFLTLMRWVERGVPLPFATIDNRRSLVSVSNLADLLLTCATHEGAANQLFLASDGPALSIGQLVRMLAEALERRARLWPAPRAGLSALATLLGRTEQVQRLCDSLEIDSSRARQRLGWVAPLSLSEGLRNTARWYQRQAKPPSTARL